jgi:hypothetical protein
MKKEITLRLSLSKGLLEKVEKFKIDLVGPAEIYLTKYIKLVTVGNSRKNK